MPRAIWSGAISFALVNIPVKLYSAISQKDVHFHQLHDADGVRIQQKRVCPADGKEVPYEHIVKGYEIAPNRYVIIKPEDIEALDPKAQHTIEIERFVKQGDIDPLYIEYSYYLVPDKGAVKPYALLLEAMSDTGRIAIARTVIRTKQYVTSLRASGKALTMSTMYFADEVVPQESLDGLPAEDVKVSDKELNMAKQLIESLTSKFDPTVYHDNYREELLALIERKAKGEAMVTQPPKKEEEKVVNLMAALEASLASARGSRKATSTTAQRPAAARSTPARKHETHGHNTHKRRNTA
jgi:DNA end-binding protein Ku